MTAVSAAMFAAVVAGTWQTAAGPLTGDGDNGGWNGFTIRIVIANAQLSFPVGTSQIRVTFEAGSVGGGEGLTISSAYVDNGAGAGDAYDFNGTAAGAPYQLLFGGLGSTTLSAGAQSASDGVGFSRVAGRDLVISMHINGGTGSDTFRSKATQTGWVSYYKVAVSEAATVNATGYSTAGPAVLGVIKVEAFA